MRAGRCPQSHLTKAGESDSNSSQASTVVQVCARTCCEEVPFKLFQRHWSPLRVRHPAGELGIEDIMKQLSCWKWSFRLDSAWAERKEEDAIPRVGLVLAYSGRERVEPRSDLFRSGG